MSIKKYLFYCGFLLGWMWVLSVYAQNTPMVVAFFRPGDTYILCFNKDIDYKEKWENIAKRYNLNKIELTRFNREDANTEIIQQHSVFVPLVFNVNLVMYPNTLPNMVYVPVYYVIPERQKVSSLHLHFREPMLSFIKNYNKIKDHYILNKNMSIFVGYLKINKAYGWNFKVAKSLHNYKTYDQVQIEMQRSASLSKLKEYSVKERSLMLFKDGNHINTGAVNVIGVNRPTEQATNKVLANLSVGLKAENLNFTSYMRRERVNIERGGNAKSTASYTNTRNVVTKVGSRLDRNVAGAISLPRGGKSLDYSFFETEYREEIANGKTEEVLTAKVKLFRLLFDESNAKFYVLFTGTTPGATVRITNRTLRKTIYAKVISNTPQSIDAEGGRTVVISEKGAEALGLKDGAAVELVLLR